MPLPRPNIDTGARRLERLASLLQGKSSVFECDVFDPWRRLVPALWRLDERSLRLVQDHLRSAVVVIGDGVRPANTGRGYVLRRLMRRVLTVLWRDDPSRRLGTCRTSWSRTPWTTSGRTWNQAMCVVNCSRRNAGSAGSWSVGAEYWPGPGSKAR